MRQFICVILAALSAPSLFAAEDRIVGAADSTRRTVLKNHVHALVQKSDDQGPVDPGMRLDYCTLMLSPAPALEAFLAEQRDPGSPSYHRWLSPPEFADRFGLSRNDIEKLTAWLESQGFTVNDVARGRHWIAFSGTAAQASRAFRTPIHRFRSGGEEHFANLSDPSIPAAFASVVSGIRGLHDFRMRSMLLREPLPQAATPEYNSSTSHYLAPDDFATIYNVAPLYAAGFDGAGQTIAVAGESDILLSDIQTFRKTYGLPPNDPEIRLFGPDPGRISSTMIEADLDLEWAGAVARNAKIIYVNSTDAFLAAQYAIDQNVAPILTLSYGSCDAYESPALRAVAQQASAQGITWFASSGDQGAATCDMAAPTPQASKGPTATFPSTIPEITSVGGTEFNDGAATGYWASSNDPTTGASALSYIPEMAWNDSLARNSFSATGGGPSVLFEKPAWQTGPGVPSSNQRATPDVSLAASPVRYAYIIYAAGAVVHVGGTSASSPAFAGIAALLSQSLGSSRLGNINPDLYRLAQAAPDVFHPITVGNNRVACVQGSSGCTDAGMGYDAGPGYNMATGLGSVDAYKLVTEWSAGTATTTTLTASPATAAQTDTVQLVATVAPAAGGDVPTGSVAFVTADIALGSASLVSAGTIATASLAVPGSRLAPGDGTIRAIYAGNGAFFGSSGTATVSLTFSPAPTGSLVVPFLTPDPVPQAGYRWPYTVGLRERAGVATTLTRFTVDGVNQSLTSWTNTAIPANGTVWASLMGSGLNAPLTRTFAFTGKDANGQTWTQQISVPFLAAAAGTAVAPGISLVSTPTVVELNPQADPSCPWIQHFTLQETGGFLVQLTKFTAGTIDNTNQIPVFFGTTRLAPFGMLQADLCWSGLTVPTSKTIVISGTSEVGTAVSSTISTSYTGPAANPATFTVSPVALTMPDSGTASIALDFAGGSPSWTASLLPANRTSGWLTLSATSGKGPAQIALQAATAGLAKGAYRTIVAISAPGAVPESIRVPVNLLVGGSGAISITGVANNASFGTGIAPGMQAAVFGSGLALGSGKLASSQPLPLSLNGVSATVNGVAAPLYYVSPRQINLQIPYEAGVGPSTLAVNNAGVVAAFPIQISVAAPGIYPVILNASTGKQNSGKVGDVITIFITGDGDVTPSLATGATPVSGTAVSRLPKSRQTVSLTVGGVAAATTASAAWFTGIPTGLVGVTQINFTIPPGVPAGTQPIVVTVGGADSLPLDLQVTQ